MTRTRVATAAATAEVRVRTKKEMRTKNLKPGGNGGLSGVKYL